MTEDEFLSKSERKRLSDELQRLGEALIELPAMEFDVLPLPENLRDAVLLARRITAHGGLARQKQYIGKLMRKIDVAPIRDALAARGERQRIEALQFRRIEQWRDRIVEEGLPAIERLLSETSASIDADTLLALANDARHERRTESPPHASRELFRLLRESLHKTTESR
jgi:ribosome-associated protein